MRFERIIVYVIKLNYKLVVLSSNLEEIGKGKQKDVNMNGFYSNLLGVFFE